jgi:hypothetical protein
MKTVSCKVRWPAKAKAVSVLAVAVVVAVHSVAGQRSEVPERSPNSILVRIYTLSSLKGTGGNGCHF